MWSLDPIIEAVVNLSLSPVMKRALRVPMRYCIKPVFGFKIAETVVQPEAVSVQGAAEDVKRLVLVETVPIELDESPGVIKRKVRLSADRKSVSFFPDQVEVSVTVEEEEINKEYSNFDVRAKTFTGEYKVNPRSVYLRLSGPKRILGRLELGYEQVYLS